MSRVGFVHVNADNTAVWVDDNGVSAPQEPVVELTGDVIRNITLNLDNGARVTFDANPTLRMYRFEASEDDTDDEPRGFPQ